MRRDHRRDGVSWRIAPADRRSLSPGAWADLRPAFTQVLRRMRSTTAKMAVLPRRRAGAPREIEAKKQGRARCARGARRAAEHSTRAACATRAQGVAVPRVHLAY